MGLTWSQSPCAHLPISYGPCSTHWSPTSGEDTLPTQVAFEIQSNGKTMAQSARKELQKVLLDIAPESADRALWAPLGNPVFPFLLQRKISLGQSKGQQCNCQQCYEFLTY